MLDYLDELNEQYYNVSQEFYELEDTDASLAFSVMKDASSLQANFEKLSADLGKECSDYEKSAKAIQAKVSRESSTKVNEGDRIAAQSELVLQAWSRVSEIQKSQRYVDATAKHLSRIYFDAKLIFENVCRATRNPVGEDKLVGRI
jgi:hypothetical protein